MTLENVLKEIRDASWATFALGYLSIGYGIKTNNEILTVYGSVLQIGSVSYLLFYLASEVVIPLNNLLYPPKKKTE